VSGALEITHQLGRMNVFRCFNSLDLHDNSRSNKQIEPLSTDCQIFVSDRHRNLPLYVHPQELQFMDQSLLVDILEQSGSEMTMHLYCRSDYLMAGFIQFRRN